MNRLFRRRALQGGGSKFLRKNIKYVQNQSKISKNLLPNNVATTYRKFIATPTHFSPDDSNVEIAC